MNAEKENGLGARPSVLIVEDEAIIRDLLVLEFEDADYVVHEAGSADEAIAILNAGTVIDAVVTDLRMPGRIDGSGLVAWLGQYRTNVPVIVTSGYASMNDFSDIVPNCIHAFTKPYKVSDVVDLVASVI